ncbi:hypothetical protein GPECTOR_64g132 [Gonium pectorale]|uniref:Glycosylphosphatidylinositol anchor attachment 1 protein n=1 Tax=Gonium pectorale TaxID=33097 RepID=A0A150G483_GONPE|nr:hypothetical protein GPECTOR_64g132 [Gonium pectorale]|eukprot:KXZ44638.1 hypothetical protein GPECTOR_64g132 [Gonium pectorale]
MARKPLLQRLMALVVSKAHSVSLALIILAALGLLALPLLERPIRFEEKGLLAGVAHATISDAPTALFQEAARIARVAAGAGNFQRPGAAAALASQLRAAGLAATQLSRPTVTRPGSPPCRCANVHSLVRSRRGDGLEALAVVTPVAFAPHRPGPDPAHDGRNQSAAAAELALMTGAALALYLAGVGAAGGGGGRWLARDVLWVVPDLACGTEACLAAWVDQYHGRERMRGRQRGPAGAPAPPLLRGGVIQQALVLEALAGAGEYDTAELLVVGHEGLLPKLDMFFLLRQLFGYMIPPALWRDDQVTRGSVSLAGRLHRALLAPAELLWSPEAARSYVDRLMRGLQFTWQQAVGLPSGPHAAFKDHMVDAATVRLVQRGGAPASAWPGARGPAAAADTAPFARSLASASELALRSLNNLVERMHHSPFLYVLTGVDGFVSVERYVGPAAAAAVVLVLQAAWSMRCVQQALAAAAGLGAARGIRIGGSGAGLAWAVATCRAATRVAVLAAVAAALRQLLCGEPFPWAMPGQQLSSADRAWYSAAMFARRALARPLLDPGAAAGAAALLGGLVSVVAAATSVAGRWAAAAVVRPVKQQSEGRADVAEGHAPGGGTGGSGAVAGGSGGLLGAAGLQLGVIYSEIEI